MTKTPEEILRQLCDDIEDVAWADGFCDGWYGAMRFMFDDEYSHEFHEDQYRAAEGAAKAQRDEIKKRVADDIAAEAAFSLPEKTDNG